MESGTNPSFSPSGSTSIPLICLVFTSPDTVGLAGQSQKGYTKNPRPCPDGEPGKGRPPQGRRLYTRRDGETPIPPVVRRRRHARGLGPYILSFTRLR